MTSVLSAASGSLVGAAGQLGWAPLVKLSKSSVLSLFSRLTSGLLEIHHLDGTIDRFGDPTLARSKASTKGDAKATSHVRAKLIVRSDSFWVRMLVGADLGFAESYMSGEVETDDLGACFQIFIHNRAAVSELSVGLVSKGVSWIQAQLNKRYANTKGGSLKNIGAHYDISNAMYEAFLSADMTYSCAVFPTLDADLSSPLLSAVTAAAKDANGSLTAPAAYRQQIGGAQRSLSFSSAAGATASSASAGTGSDSGIASSSPVLLAEDELEDGQLRKLRLHIERADIRRGHKVLEIGTGWGSFSMEAVRMTGCTVDSLTLSIEQKALAEARIAAAGLSDSITVHLMDYRDMPASWTDSFDRIVSIEMLEAVGIEFLSTYFSCCDRVLKRKGGAACFQCITMPESRFDAYASQVDFIKKWIFPGGVLPSVTALVDAATKGSQGRLIMDTAVNIGPHYSRTLREWRRRFEAAFDETIRPALLSDHDAIRALPKKEQEREVEVFRKKWLYYFIYCEVGFTERVIGDHVISFTREGNSTLPVCCG